MSTKKPAPPVEEYTSPDGFGHSLAQERTLNDLAARLFKTEDGQRFLAYLRNITINRITGPEVPDIQLRHLEGQRFIVAIIERRISDGREQRPSRPAERE